MFKKPYREGDKKESGFSMQIIGEILRQAGRMPVCNNGSIRMPAGTTETVIITKSVKASTIDGGKISGTEPEPTGSSASTRSGKRLVAMLKLV